MSVNVATSRIATSLNSHSHGHHPSIPDLISSKTPCIKISTTNVSLCSMSSQESSPDDSTPDLSSIPTCRSPKKCVKFSRFSRVVETWAPEEYDRTSVCRNRDGSVAADADME